MILQAGVIARNRDMLIQHVANSIMQRHGVMQNAFAKPVLQFTMSCGYTFSAASMEDIPFESLMCPCGKHWVIYYQEHYAGAHQN